MSFTDRSNLRQPPLGRRLRLGFAGGGRGGLVGEWHHAGARLSNHWQVVGGALSSRPENAVLSGRDWMIDPARSYSDFRRMATEEAARPDGVEAVTICTPNASHAEIALAFLEAGIDVILDKPMTSVLADAETLVARAAALNRLVVMTYPYRHYPMIAQARALIDRGEIGAVRQLHVEYLQEWNVGAADPAAPAWRQDPAQVGRSAIIGDIGTHAYNLLKAATGHDLQALRAEMHVCGGAKPLPDTAFVSLRLDNGAPGMMHVSQAAIGQYCGLRLRIWGETGAIDWDQEMPERLRVVRLGQAEQIVIRGSGNGMLPEGEALAHLPRGHGEALTDAWANLYALAGLAIARHRSGEAVDLAALGLSGAQDGLAGMRFIDACADSAEAGAVWVDL